MRDSRCPRGAGDRSGLTSNGGRKNQPGYNNIEYISKVGLKEHFIKSILLIAQGRVIRMDADETFRQFSKETRERDKNN